MRRYCPATALERRILAALKEASPDMKLVDLAKKLDMHVADLLGELKVLQAKGIISLFC